jgi:lysophospholipase L1-like esterase
MLEPMVAKVIAAQKANLITLKIGVNTFSGHYSARTFLPAVLGMLYTIREKQTNTPIIVISPFYCPGRETERYTKTSLILPEIRNVLKNTVDLFQSRGDRFIYYLDGLSIFNADKMQYLPDGVHPNAEGQFVIAHAMVPHIQRILCEH